MHLISTCTLLHAIQVISYESLRQQLDIATVRQLEDFIITECFYTNIISGKLDQKKACLQVGVFCSILHTKRRCDYNRAVLPALRVLLSTIADDAVGNACHNLRCTQSRASTRSLGMRTPQADMCPSCERLRHALLSLTYQVHNAIGRDVRPEQLPELEAGLQSWCVRTWCSIFFRATLRFLSILCRFSVVM